MLGAGSYNPEDRRGKKKSKSQAMDELVEVVCSILAKLLIGMMYLHCLCMIRAEPGLLLPCRSQPASLTTLSQRW